LSVCMTFPARAVAAPKASAPFGDSAPVSSGRLE
jgi:hypothetical protein